MRSTLCIAGSLALLLMAAPATAQSVDLPLGAPAPYNGLLLDEPTAKAVVEDVRDARAAADVIGALKAQVAALQEANKQYEIALARAEEREKFRTEQVELLMTLLREHRMLMADVREDLQASRKEIARLQKQAIIDRFLAILGPIGFAAGLFLH